LVLRAIWGLKELSQRNEAAVSLGVVENLNQGEKSEGASRAIDGKF